jgi:hypothetical protein
LYSSGSEIESVVSPTRAGGARRILMRGNPWLKSLRSTTMLVPRPAELPNLVKKIVVKAGVARGIPIRAILGKEIGCGCRPEDKQRNRPISAIFQVP